MTIHFSIFSFFRSNLVRCSLQSLFRSFLRKTLRNFRLRRLRWLLQGKKNYFLKNKFNKVLKVAIISSFSWKIGLWQTSIKLLWKPNQYFNNFLLNDYFREMLLKNELRIKWRLLQVKSICLPTRFSNFFSCFLKLILLVTFSQFSSNL